MTSARRTPLDVGQQVEAALILGPAAHLLVQPRHRLHVVVEDFRRRFQHAVDRRQIAEEVGRQHFDDGPGSLAHGQDAAAEVVGAAVGQVVARHRGDDDVPQAQPMGRLGDAGRFVVFEVVGPALGDRAEAARPGADVAEDHEGGGAAGVTLGPIGTAGVLADRLQAQLAQQLLGEEIPISARQLALQPRRQTPMGG